MNNKILKTFLKYSSLSMLSAMGMSCYILADTLFIANGVGSIGLTSLNLIMPIYNVIFGIGLLLAIGGATKFSILRSQGREEEAKHFFTLAIIIGLIVSIPFLIVGLFFSQDVVQMLGANEEAMQTSVIYLKTIILFTPFFILNQIVVAFVRNDHNPKIASIAMLSGTLFNIVFDYVLVFPCGLGMFGAAIATAVSPIVSLCICSFHLFSKKSHLKMNKCSIDYNPIWSMIKIGTPAFITELSAGIVIFAFNIVILNIGGNIAVASYGIISNLAIMVISLYTGISQGMQPLVSQSYGRNETKKSHTFLKYSFIFSLVISVLIYLITVFAPEAIIHFFNSENNETMTALAKNGLLIYFIGFFFAGLNMIAVTYFACVERIKYSLTISILRGGVLIIPLLLILSQMFGMNGVWISYPLSELTILLTVYYFYKKQLHLEAQKDA